MTLQATKNNAHRSCCAPLNVTETRKLLSKIAPQDRKHSVVQLLHVSLLPDSLAHVSVLQYVTALLQLQCSV
jgi:hypothetical protein